MTTNFLNWATVASFAVMAYGLAVQIRKIRKRRSVGDISLIEVTLRTTANTILLAKMVTTHDPFLITGSALMWGFMVTLTAHVYSMRRLR